MCTILKRVFLIAIALALASTARAETCIQLERANAGDDNIDMLIAPVALTVAGIACHCDGACTAPIATLALTDRAGNAISLTSTLTCSTGTGLSTWASTDAGDSDRNLIVGEGLEVSVTNNPPSFDLITVCIRFS